MVNAFYRPNKLDATWPCTCCQLSWSPSLLMLLEEEAEIEAKLAGFSDLSKVTQPDRDRVQVRTHCPEKLPGVALTQNSDKWQILTLS